MNKLIVGAALASLMMVTGCKTPLEPQAVETIATSIGVATGCVITQTKMDEVTKTNIVYVASVLENVIPDTNSTFVVTWIPYVNDKVVPDLIAKGKINEDQGVMIVTATALIAEGVDYMFTRHPEWKQNSDLVVIAVKGFTFGLKKSIGIDVDTYCASMVEMDLGAYNYLSKKKK